MRKFLSLPICAISLVLLCAGSHLAALPSSPVVHVIELNDDTINPVTAEYISRSIDQAEEEGAQCLVIKLDTPGGLLNSTRTIVKKILSARIPVVVYIAPDGSRAGSAGVFITYASHIAAMSPSTNIGAAHPVQIGEQKKEQKDDNYWDGLKELLKTMNEKNEEREKTAGDKAEGKQAKKEDSAKEQQKEEPEIEADPDPMSSKILQDTVAFVKSLAEERDRNVEWAIKSVTKSSSITASEALELKVVEIIARDETDLLNQLDGRSVKVADKDLVLRTKDAPVKRIPMTFRQKFFNVLANPNIAYIFMILGFYGLLYEVTHPGFGAPGILGFIFLVLAFYSMQALPTNYAAVALIILGLVLLVAEAFVPGFGLLTLAGVGCMILGSMLLFDSSLPMMKVSKGLIFSLTLTTALITTFLVQATIRAHSRKIKGGREGLIGEKGEARTLIGTEQEGRVFVHGELWNAVSDESIPAGEKVTVTAVEGLTVKVKKLKKGN
ncbi:MAG: nodulation protein NfeD [Candidatus Omnitrophota bacterium]|nr:nodulation protein NfeD [Candidatus Omnitrophota bacterium]MDZ4242275.1 nodulation protein NfeD [Candidatus Omnitrophota bacterium]